MNRTSTGDELLTLHVETDPHGLVTARIPVRWSVTPALIAKLREKEYQNPHLMLVVRSLRDKGVAGHEFVEYTDTSVQVVRLTAELDYVTFAGAGTHQVCAVVVDLANRDAAAMVARWEKYPGRYDYYCEDTEEGPTVFTDNSLLKASGLPKPSAFNEHPWVPYLPAITMLWVSVPQEMFAPKPSGWPLSLVRAYYGDTTETDQCHFRSRLIKSLLASVVWLPLSFILKVLVTAFALLWGQRDIPFDFLIQPLRQLNPIEIWRYTEPSRWFYDEEYKPRHWLRWAYSPPVLLALPPLPWMVTAWVFDYDMSLLESYLMLWIAITLVVLAVYAIKGAVVVVLGFLHLIGASSLLWFNPERRAQRAATAVQRRQAKQHQLLLELEDMTDTPASVTVSSLPDDKQTIHLKWNAFKTRVCQPFAKW